MEKVNHKPRRRGYEARDREELINTIIKLHNDGLSQVDIAKKLKLSRGTILRWNKELKFFHPRTPGEGGKIKSKIYDYDENYFETISTPNQAYIIGYILGDGTILDRKKSKRLVLSLAEQDKQLLYDIANELNMTEAIKFRKRNAPNEQNKYSLVINSTKMCNDLIQLGIAPKKTKNEEWIEFNNNELQWAFLRGFFDADGHIRVYLKDNYLKTRIGFTGTKEMLESILSFLKSRNIGLRVNSIIQKEGCYDLYISSVIDAKEIYTHLYKDGSIKLNRKYEKFSSLMI